MLAKYSTVMTIIHVSSATPIAPSLDRFSDEAIVPSSAPKAKGKGSRMGSYAILHSYCMNLVSASNKVKFLGPGGKRRYVIVRRERMLV
jgi:hypothetical protein